MKLYVSRVNLFTNKEGTPKCSLEGIRYKKENEGFKAEYKKIYLNNYPPSWHTDLFTIPYIVEIRFDKDTKEYKVV